MTSTSSTTSILNELESNPPFLSCPDCVCTQYYADTTTPNSEVLVRMKLCDVHKTSILAPNPAPALSLSPTSCSPTSCLFDDLQDLIAVTTDPCLLKILTTPPCTAAAPSSPALRSTGPTRRRKRYNTVKSTSDVEETYGDILLIQKSTDCSVTEACRMRGLNKSKFYRTRYIAELGIIDAGR